MTERLSGKVALVTGASRGIGKAIAEAFAAQGCALVVNAREPTRLEATAEQIRARFGVSVQVAACDVTEAEAVQAMVRAAEAVAPIDILVNNAGIHVPSDFLSYTFDDFRAVMESNVYSVFHVSQAVLRHMVDRRSGRVINIASTAGKWGSKNQSAYNASKHAVVGMTRCLGLEMAPNNVFVNAICPWVVNTDMADSFMSKHAALVGLDAEELRQRLSASVPLNRLVEPAEVAGLAVYLASDEASYINGQAWTVDGGYTMI